eukprot:scaffold4998_cov120-Isochrysis_galbana.AAC.2
MDISRLEPGARATSGNSIVIGVPSAGCSLPIAKAAAAPSTITAETDSPRVSSTTLVAGCSSVSCHLATPFRMLASKSTSSSSDRCENSTACRLLKVQGSFGRGTVGGVVIANARIFTASLSKIGTTQGKGGRDYRS